LRPFGFMNVFNIYINRNVHTFSPIDYVSLFLSFFLSFFDGYCLYLGTEQKVANAEEERENEEITNDSEEDEAYLFI